EGLKEGVIDAIATDHAPHTRADKTCDFEKAAFGISGFETALASLISLVDSGAIDLLTLISKLTIEPARIVATHQVTGSLKVGSLADITIFDPDAEWWVDPEGFVSKGKNTPLAGSVLTGKVMATIASGKLIYES
ncbi:MAG: amidohydrolase family protein, partial [Chloroflexota bacterium]|nr:amidohydrolase family protein [Chloroflexota bacterium]